MALPSFLITDVRRQGLSSAFSSPALSMSPTVGKNKSAYDDSVCLRHTIYVILQAVKHTRRYICGREKKPA
jgi:hypothetical protein